jgi:FtsP/CotA-like multicopper oxidase with cupredoxin domain
MTILGRRPLAAGFASAALGYSLAAHADGTAPPEAAAQAGNAAKPEKRVFNMTIEDTIITLVEDQKYHTFAFNGQVPAPLIHVNEGDDLEITVENDTTLPHTIHWHGLLQTGTWTSDGVPDITMKAIQPGDTFTFKFKAEPAGTYWYHCHVNVNEHVALRGMWGPFIVVPRNPKPIEKEVTKDYILMFTSWDSKYWDKPGYGGTPGDVSDYYTINGKAFPETQPIRVKKGDLVRLRLIGAGDQMSSIHLHGHVFDIWAKDGHPLPAPIQADTVLVAPGERYDILFRANNPGIWMVHDHIDMHTVNKTKPMGGIMTTVEYEEVDPVKQSFYMWANKKFVPDFYYEESLKMPLGIHNNVVFKGVPAE